MKWLPLMLLASALVAADPATDANQSERPFLGVSLEAGDNFDGASLRVTRVVPSATFDKLGVKVDDLMVSVNGAHIATLDEFSAATASLKSGDAIAVAIRRDGKDDSLKGTVQAMPRPRDVATDAQKLKGELADLKGSLDKAEMKSSLERTLLLLKEFQAGLPQAAAEFKKLYPGGTFDIDIHVVIKSDPDAKAPDVLQPAPKPATTEPASESK